MGAAGSRRNEALGRGVRLGLSGAHPPGSVAEAGPSSAESNAGRDGEKARANQDPRSRPVNAGRPRVGHLRLGARDWDPGGESKPDTDQTRGLRTDFLSIGFSRPPGRRGRGLGLFLEAARTVRPEGQNTSLANSQEPASAYGKMSGGFENSNFSRPVSLMRT